MIDCQERAVMEQTVRGAIANGVAHGNDIDAVLAELGWLELLENEPDDAIDIVFSALGAANAAATALDDVLAAALGEKPRADLAGSAAAAPIRDCRRETLLIEAHAGRVLVVSV